MRLWETILGALVGAAVGWGVMQQTVAEHTRRIDQIEQAAAKRQDMDFQILQRLTAIETKLEDLRAAAARGR